MWSLKRFLQFLHRSTDFFFLQCDDPNNLILLLFKKLKGGSLPWVALLHATTMSFSFTQTLTARLKRSSLTS
jgi:hypothetical protein